jgi:hypothetical protein
VFLEDDLICIRFHGMCLERFIVFFFFLFFVFAQTDITIDFLSLSLSLSLSVLLPPPSLEHFVCINKDFSDRLSDMAQNEGLYRMNRGALIKAGGNNREGSGESGGTRGNRR